MKDATDSFGAFLRKIENLVVQGQFDRALQLISDVALHAANAAHLQGRVRSSPGLDRMCCQIGAMTWPAHGARTTLSEPRPRIYVVTELGKLGGHTRVLHDFIHLQPGMHHHVLATNLFNRDRGLVVPDFVRAAAHDVRIAPAVGLLDKLTWLQTRLAELAPADVFLLTHWHDAVAIAAVQPAAGTGVFVHHADYTFTLGMHVPHLMHVDLHGLCFEHCARYGISNCVLWPNVIADDGQRDAAELCKDARIATTCSSGTLNKFTGPYPFSYFELVPLILDKTGGRHIHIGPLDDKHLMQMRRGLAARNIAIDRFVHVPSVPNLWRAMAEHSVDAYITSFPVFGARAALEVIGSGTPILSHRNLFNDALSDTHLLHPDVLCWSTPEDLLGMLGALGPGELRRQAAAGRAWYLAHNHPDRLKPLLATVGEWASRPRGSANPRGGTSTDAHLIEPLNRFALPDRIGPELEWQLTFARLLNDTGMGPEVDRNLEQLVKLQTPFAHLLYLAGVRAYAKEDYAGSIPYFELAARLNPDLPDFQISLEGAHVMAGNRMRALALKLRRRTRTLYLMGLLARAKRLLFKSGPPRTIESDLRK